MYAENGYTGFFNKLLAHDNINVLLNTDALDMIKIDTENKRMLFNDKTILIPVVYTGAIDELLGYKYGPLPYRSLRFDYQTKKTESFQDASVVAHPEAEGYTRITEYKKLPPQNIPGITTVAYEYPLPADKKKEPYYPIINNENLSLYNKYYKEIKAIPDLLLCGRLADYKYYNMDAAILRAFAVFSEIIKSTT